MLTRAPCLCLGRCAAAGVYRRLRRRRCVMHRTLSEHDVADACSAQRRLALVSRRRWRGWAWSGGSSRRGRARRSWTPSRRRSPLTWRAATPCSKMCTPPSLPQCWRAEAPRCAAPASSATTLHAAARSGRAPRPHGSASWTLLVMLDQRCGASMARCPSRDGKQAQLR